MFICPPSPPNHKKENRTLDPLQKGNEKKTIMKLPNTADSRLRTAKNNNRDDDDNEQ